MLVVLLKQMRNITIHTKGYTYLIFNCLTITILVKIMQKFLYGLKKIFIFDKYFFDLKKIALL